MHKYETKVTNDNKQDKGRGKKLWDNKKLDQEYYSSGLVEILAGLGR